MIRKITFAILALGFVVAAILLAPKNAKNDLIRVHFPSPESIIQSPLNISGKARGTWYFEATFPIKLIDENGHALTSHYAQAEGEWMTENFVPFTGELKFTINKRTPAFLILQKDNPSGLPQYDDEIRIPLILDPSTK